MRPTKTFLDLIRTVNRDNASDVVERLRALVAAEEQTEARRDGMRRHLETLAFRLACDDRLGAAADTYAVIAGLV
ncbi:glycosyltransferase family 61 protein, partial|uniref:hypothetical protein n=1 Tax=Escherichia coli TaxID=562 RepID=UPI0016914483